MDLIIAILLPFLLSNAIAACFAGIIYRFRRSTIDSRLKMNSFLAKKFNLIRQNGFWGKEQDYIDEKLIRKWGNNGWSFLALPAINLSLFSEITFGLGMLSSIGLLFFSGLVWGDSRAALYCLRQLDLSRYTPPSPIR